MKGKKKGVSQPKDNKSAKKGDGNKSVESPPPKQAKEKMQGTFGQEVLQPEIQRVQREVAEAAEMMRL
jgi:hypothetical protein